MSDDAEGPGDLTTMAVRITYFDNIDRVVFKAIGRDGEGNVVDWIRSLEPKRMEAGLRLLECELRTFAASVK